MVVDTRDDLSSTTDDGNTTLREAILKGNADGVNQTVYFYLQGNEPRTILLDADLAVVKAPLFSNGNVQDEISIQPKEATNGIELSGGSSIKSLSFNNFSDFGVKLSGDGNSIENSSYSSNGTAKGLLHPII